MSFLCDTNIISELARPLPNPGVLAWSKSISSIFLSAITLEEIYYGLSAKPNHRIQTWLDNFLVTYCQIIPVNPEIAKRAGELRGYLQTQGKPRTQADIIINKQKRLRIQAYLNYKYHQNSIFGGAAMVQQVTPGTTIEVIYPESDGQPMADNTEQFAWIVKIKENLEILFPSPADVFIAGDLFWYPLKGNPNIKQAPDTMVVFGRPKGKRGSYLQWDEDNIPPQVVFEILSPGNTLKEMTKKLQFYQRYGVEEYYIYDPAKNDLNGLLRSGDSFEVIEEMNGWVSPRLGIRFTLTPDTLEIVSPTGQKFLTTVEIDQLREQERLAKEAALEELEKERDRYQQLLAKLKEQGIDTDNL